MLVLALIECVKLNIKKVLITCDKDNVASAKTIINNNSTVLIEDDGSIIGFYGVIVERNETKQYHDGKWLLIRIEYERYINELIEMIKIKKKPKKKAIKI